MALVGVGGPVGGLHALWHAPGTAMPASRSPLVVFAHNLPAAVIGAVCVGGTGRCRIRCEIDAVKERFASRLADLAGLMANGTSPAAIPSVKLSATATEFDAELVVVGSGRHGTRRLGVASATALHDPIRPRVRRTMNRSPNQTGLTSRGQPVLAMSLRSEVDSSNQRQVLSRWAVLIPGVLLTAAPGRMLTQPRPLPSARAVAPHRAHPMRSRRAEGPHRTPHRENAPLAAGAHPVARVVALEHGTASKGGHNMPSNGRNAAATACGYQDPAPRSVSSVAP